MILINPDDKFDIIKLALSEFQNILRSLQSHYLKELYITKHGVPPKSLLVKYHDYFGSMGRKRGNSISAWRVFGDKIENVKTSCNAELEPRDGMFYNEGTCYLSLSPDLRYLNIEWQVGPLYGCGYRYKVIKDGLLSIIQEQYLWRS